jgi:hypothetical protein
MIVFTPAPPEVMSLANQVMHEYHATLVEADVAIGIIVRTKIQDDEEVPSLKLHGAMAYATVKVIGRKQRTYVDHDAQIELDGPVWKTLSAASKKALIDHELNHLVVKCDQDTGKPKEDDLGRPVLAIRPDDFTVTGFLDVIKRHGQAALEYQSITRIHAAVMEAARTVTEKVVADSAAA